MEQVDGSDLYYEEESVYAVLKCNDEQHGEFLKFSPRGHQSNTPLVSPRASQLISPRNSQLISLRSSQPSTPFSEMFVAVFNISSSPFVALPPLPTPYPPQASQYLKDSLSSLSSYLNQQSASLKDIEGQQFLLIHNPNEYGKFYPQLQIAHTQLLESLKKETSFLLKIHEEFILDPFDLNRVETLHHLIRVQKAQLELYMMELELFSQSRRPIPPQARLVIDRQPFPTVLHKDQHLKEGEFMVKLLTGTQGCPITAKNMLTASLVFDNVSVKGSPLKNAESFLSNNEASFSLQFGSGTKKRPACIKVSGVIQVHSFKFNVESENSKPFIVTTNESQWIDSAGTLLKKEAFGESPCVQISWPQFVNTFHRHFLNITKQSLSNPKRPLSLHDFQYLQSRCFGNRTVVTTKDFDDFWKWFGRIAHMLRHQKHICDLWTDGVIYGLLEKERANEVLHGQPKGTFVVRFSENNPGHLGIANSSMGDASHYLFSEESCTKKSFSDWILECKEFTNVLQLISDPSSPPYFKRVHKAEPIHPSARKSQQLLGNYLPPP